MYISLYIMRATKYKKVDILPDGAKTVQNYAASTNITVSYVYNKYLRGRADYSIINYQGINFVVAENCNIDTGSVINHV